MDAGADCSLFDTGDARSSDVFLFSPTKPYEYSRRRQVGSLLLLNPMNIPGDVRSGLFVGIPIQRAGYHTYSVVCIYIASYPTGIY